MKNVMFLNEFLRLNVHQFKDIPVYDVTTLPSGLSVPLEEYIFYFDLEFVPDNSVESQCRYKKIKPFWFGGVVFDLEGNPVFAVSQKIKPCVKELTIEQKIAFKMSKIDYHNGFKHHIPLKELSGRLKKTFNKSLWVCFGEDFDVLKAHDFFSNTPPNVDLSVLAKNVLGRNIGLYKTFLFVTEKLGYLKGYPSFPKSLRHNPVFDSYMLGIVDFAIRNQGINFLKNNENLLLKK